MVRTRGQALAQTRGLVRGQAQVRVLETILVLKSRAEKHSSEEHETLEQEHLETQAEAH